MADNIIKPERLPNSSNTTSDVPRFGCLDMELLGGVVHFHDAEQAAQGMIFADDGKGWVNILLWNSGADGVAGVGLMALFDADSARSFAASLIDGANRLDGAKGLS
jgi:hypothetical protein